MGGGHERMMASHDLLVLDFGVDLVEKTGRGRRC